jgi:hypothetical protein
MVTDQRHRLARRPVDLGRGRHHPSGEDDEDGLEEFRRLHRGEAQRIPAHRALPVIGAEDRQKHQRGHRREEAENGEPPHRDRRHHRDENHHAQRKAAECELPDHVVEGLMPVAGGQRRRRRETQKDADREKREDAAYGDPVHRPPPTRQYGVAGLHDNRAMRHFRHVACPDPEGPLFIWFSGLWLPVSLLSRAG